MLRGTALALVFATSILSLANCGGDDTSNTVGGSGSGGTGGSGATGGASGAGGSAGATGGAAGGKSGSGGTGGASGGGQGGAAGGDASPPMDARADTTPGTDSSADRGGSDAPSADTGSQPDAARDSTNDGTTTDTSVPPDSTSDGAPPGDAASDTGGDVGGDGSAAMVLTSSGFTEGAMIPSDFTCAGTNVSPPLQWTAGPPGTKSYALVFKDVTPNAVLTHSIVYDIPVNTMSLPMNLEKVASPSTPAGAKQTTGYDSKTYGYLGPCPGGSLHTYQFSIRAIDVDTLPGVTSATRAIVEPIINAHTLGTGVLGGQSNAKQ